MWAGGKFWHRWKRPQASCTASLERTFSKRYLSVLSNFATLIPLTAVMQQKRSRGWMLYSPRPRSLYILIRCNSPLVECVLVYICLGLWGRSGFVYHSAWADFTLLILKWGQCEGLIVGIGAERNFTPTSFFVPSDQGWFHFRMLMRVTTSKGRSWPGAGLCPLQTMMDFSSH